MKKTLLIAYFLGLLFLPVYAESPDFCAFSVQNIAKIFAALDAENKYTKQLDSSELYIFPMGIKKTVNDNEYSIAISNIRFYPDYAEMTIFARMQISQLSEPIYFAATDVKFSPNNNFIASLSMCGDVDIPINKHTILKLRGGVFEPTNGTVAPGLKTSMTVDSSGFKELNIEAGLVLGDSYIQKISESNNVLLEPVNYDLFMTVNDWNELFLLFNPESIINDISIHLKTDLTVPIGGNLNYNSTAGALVITDAEGNQVEGGNIQLPPNVVERINSGESFSCTMMNSNRDINVVTFEDGQALRW